MKNRIIDWPESQRPYERFYEKGADALSDQEILAIIIGNGSKGKNVLALSSDVMNAYARNDGLSSLHDVSIEELQAINGIGFSKAIRIKAALELGKRSVSPSFNKKADFSSPKQIAKVYQTKLENLAREELHVLFLDRKNKFIRDLILSKGGLSSTVIDPRDLFREAIKANAAAFVLIHNHPSGDPTPSNDDIRTTIRFKESGQFLGITLHDHLIIGKNRFISLASDERYSSIFAN